jgi:hypothetical protein
MKKTFDCVKFQREVREKLWIESGESVEGLFRLLDERTKKNKLWIKLVERKEEEKQLTTV